MPKLRHIKEAEGRKRAKLPWPPVGEGGEFIVEKEDAEKWSKTTHTSTVATACFIVTGLGVRCRELSCGNSGFAEAPAGESNHASSLHSCDKHVASFHPPPTKVAPSVRDFFSKKTKQEVETAAGVTGAPALATASYVGESSASSSTSSLQTIPIAAGVVDMSTTSLVGTEVSTVQCPGLPWPGPMPMLAHYPFQIHALHHPSVTWDASTGGYLRSKTPTCTGYALEGGVLYFSGLNGSAGAALRNYSRPARAGHAGRLHPVRRAGYRGDVHRGHLFAPP